MHDRKLSGSSGVVFSSRRKAIFVHGCFWHRHGLRECKLARLPNSNLQFWLPKLAGNSERDGRNEAKLDVLGWRWMVVWECEVRQEEQLTNKLISFLQEASA